jgi:hypothetical protein
MAKKTWEVRNMDEVDTDDAVAAARRAHQKMAEWLTDAIREKIARERLDIGEVMAPETPTEGWSPLALIQTLEAYEHVMRLRGKPLSPRSRVLIAAERALHARLLPAVRPVLTHRPDGPDAPSRQMTVPTHRPDSPDAPSRQIAAAENPDIA